MNNQPQKKPVQRKTGIGMYIIILVILAGCIALIFNNNSSKDRLKVSEFENYLTEPSSAITIETVYIKPATGNNSNLYYVYGTYKDAGNKETSYDLYIDKDIFRENYHNIIVNDGTITYGTVPASNNNWLNIILSLLPLAAIIIIFVIIMKSSAGGNNKAFDFGKNRARLSRDKSVTFKDVAGCDEEKQELEEIIDFLKNPRKYVEIGARIPKGILLCGSPGTGKTLLAKAVAGEANVPFFSISGSDFVEMFVGVGASRVRDLFKVAKENCPCIVFIDEIDAVGRQRGTGLGGGHDEREQTLNQLLVEMDGFGNNSGVIIIAATNRPDVLDPALLRPGRFDRQITIANPDVVGREAILKVHARNKLFASNVIFSEVAQRIPGFSGAEIENLLNEAALLAARANRKVIEIFDIDEAVDRVMMGPAKKSRKFTSKERLLVAHHEAGHAVIGVKLDNANIVQKVTIVPRGNAGGYALMLPEEDTFLETKQSLLDRITGLLGGRVSEEIMFNEMSTGAHNDFQQATKIARAMVTEYGMSDLGPIQYENNGGSVFLGRDYFNEKNFSDTIAAEIDNQVQIIIHGCYEKAKQVLTENKSLVERIAHYLLEIETLTKKDIYEIVDTNTLAWWEEKKAADAAKISALKAAEEKAAVNEEPENKSKDDDDNKDENKVIH